MGVLDWPPSEFWQATPHDLHAALDGWNEKNGGRQDALDDDDRAELYAELQKALEAERGRNNP